MGGCSDFPLDFLWILLKIIRLYFCSNIVLHQHSKNYCYINIFTFKCLYPNRLCDAGAALPEAARQLDGRKPGRHPDSCGRRRHRWLAFLAVPAGALIFLPLYPVLKRWAKLFCPFLGWFFACSYHSRDQKLVLTHTPKRRAKLSRPRWLSRAGHLGRDPRGLFRSGHAEGSTVAML